MGLRAARRTRNHGEGAGKPSIERRSRELRRPAFRGTRASVKLSAGSDRRKGGRPKQRDASAWMGSPGPTMRRRGGDENGAHGGQIGIAKRATGALAAKLS